MRRTLITFLLFALPALLQKATAQQAGADSLRALYLQEKNPAKQFSFYLQYATEMLEINLPGADLYADTLSTLAKKSGQKDQEADLLVYRGKIRKGRGEFNEALQFFIQSLDVRKLLNDPPGLARNYVDIGATWAELYQSDSAIENYIRAAAFYEKAGDYSNMASTYGNIGNLYSDMELHDKAFSYLEKALAIRLQHGEEKKCMYTYNNLATAYGKAGQIDKAMEYAEKGITIALKFDNQYVAGVIYGGIGHLLNEKKMYTKAIEYCEKSAKLLEDAGRKPNLVFPLVNLATAYNALDKPDKALQYALKGYAIMQETQQADPLEVYYEEIAHAYEKLGNHKASLEWYKKFMQLDDSLFRAENIKNLADIDTKYQTQKKETEITRQKLDIAEKNNQLFRQKSWIYGLIAVFLVLAITAFFLYNRYRQKQKAAMDAAVIREQQLGLNAVIEAQELERKRIARDLHDGIAQEMVAVKLGFEQFSPLLSANQHYNQLMKNLGDACTGVRNISHVMSPPILENKGLAGSLDMLLRNSLGMTSIKHHFENLGMKERVDEKIEIGLYRIAQELINNIIKHARASEVSMQLQKTGSQLILRLEDNGESFDFEAAKEKGSMGLLNILSRVRTLNGQFLSEPSQPHGTISLVRIPVS
ncbi:MAG: sensor histidine kinase [Chitinophagaceae bacterium]|nr:sensor histidine kinase [Chitinophagaceae bacterium]